MNLYIYIYITYTIIYIKRIQYTDHILFIYIIAICKSYIYIYTYIHTILDQRNATT